MSRARRDKLLLVSYFFPPLGMGGVQRVAALTRHLSRLGWDVTVLTVDAVRYPAYDESLLDWIPPDTRVYRAPSADLARLRSLCLSKQSVAAPSDSLGGFAGRMMMLPDSRVAAIPGLLGAVPELLRRAMPDVVLTSSPPPSIHLVGVWLRRMYGIPWVADYRDVWFPQTEIRYATRLHRNLQSWLKRSYVRRSDATVAVTEGHSELLRIETGLSEEKLHLIPNGFEDECFAEDCPDQPSGTPFTVGYSGTLNHLTYTPALFENAVSLSRDVALRIDLAGHVGVPAIGDLGRIDPGQSVVRMLGYRNHLDCVRFMRQCDANLVTLAPSMHLDHTVPGKVYELLRVEKPIIACVPRDGSAWRLLSRFDGVMMVDPTDVACNRDALMNLVSGGRNWIAKRAGVERYSWTNLAREYDSVLKGVLCRRKSR